MAAPLVQSHSSLAETGECRREVALYALQNVGIGGEAGPRESGVKCDTEASVLDVTIQLQYNKRIEGLDNARRRCWQVYRLQDYATPYSYTR
jgi:hypothetical protein